MAWFTPWGLAPRNPASVGLLHQVNARRGQEVLSGGPALSGGGVQPARVMSPEELEALHMYGVDPGKQLPIGRIGKQYGPLVDPKTGVFHRGTLTPDSVVGRGGDPWYEKYNPPATTVFADEYGDPQGLEDRTPAWQARRERHLGLLPVTKAPVEPHDQPGVIPPTVQAMTPEQARGLLRQAKLATPEQLEGLARRLRAKAWEKGAASLTPYEQQLSRALRVLQSGLTIKEPHWYGTTDVSDEPFRGQYLEAPPVFKDQPWVDEQYDIEGVDAPTATGPVQLSPKAAAERRQIRIPINTRAGPGTNFAPAQGIGYERATGPLVVPAERTSSARLGPTAEQQRIQELMKPPPPGMYDPAVPKLSLKNDVGEVVRQARELFLTPAEALREQQEEEQMYGGPPLPPGGEGVRVPTVGEITGAAGEFIGDLFPPKLAPEQGPHRPDILSKTQPESQATAPGEVPVVVPPAVQPAVAPPAVQPAVERAVPIPKPRPPEAALGLIPGGVPAQPQVGGFPEQFGDPWGWEVPPGTEWDQGQGGEMLGGPEGLRKDPKDPKEPPGLLGGILKDLSGYISERSGPLGLLGAGLIAAGAPTTIPGKNQRDIFKAVQAYTEAVQKGDTEATARRKAEIELVGLELENTREALKLKSDQKAEDWWKNGANLTVAADRLGITEDEYRNLMSGLSVSERIKSHLENLEGPKPTFAQQKNNREITVNRDFVVKWVGTTGQERLAASIAAKDGKYKTIADVINRAIDEAHKSPFRGILTEENPDYVPALAAARKKATRSITGLEDPNYQLWVARNWNALVPSPVAPKTVSDTVPTADGQPDQIAAQKSGLKARWDAAMAMPDSPEKWELLQKIGEQIWAKRLDPAPASDSS